MKKTVLISLGAIAFLFSCNSGSSPDVDHKSGNELDSLAENAVKAIDSNDQTVLIINAIISSIPSPLEMALVVKTSGAPFSKSYLNDPANAKEYSTNVKRAVNLGVYGADLGYSNLYKQNTSSLEYIKVIKSIADELKIGHFFDFTTLQKMAENKDNIIELINVSQSNFNDINHYLREQDRSNISTAILIGGWVEALYLSTKVAHKKGKINEKLLEGIGYQKIILQDLLLLIDAFNDNAEFKYLEGELKSVQTAFENVTITYEEIESTDSEPVIDENGIPVFQSTTTSHVNITSEDLEKISSSIKSARDHIIK